MVKLMAILGKVLNLKKRLLKHYIILREVIGCELWTNNFNCFSFLEDLREVIVRSHNMMKYTLCASLAGDLN